MGKQPSATYTLKPFRMLDMVERNAVIHKLPGNLHMKKSEWKTKKIDWLVLAGDEVSLRQRMKKNNLKAYQCHFGCLQWRVQSPGGLNRM